MAIAHVCPRCGHDLARQRPQREPHYNLRLIVCACGWATTRAMHPILRNWRWCVRLLPALLTIGAQIALIVLLAAMTLACTAGLASLSLRYEIAYILDEYRVFLIVALGILPIATGAWLRATFSHWRYFTQWPAWGLFIAIVITVAHIVLPAAHAKAYEIGAVPWPPSETVADLLPLWRRTLVALVCLLALSLLGAPLGVAMVIVHARRRRARWHRRKRRWRARGLSA